MTASMDDFPVGQLGSVVDTDPDGQVCGWAFNTGDGRLVYAGEISNARFAELDEEEREALGGKPFGWFLMCFWHDRSEVWGKMPSEDTARRMVMLIGSMLYAGVLWRAEDREGARAAVDLAQPMQPEMMGALCPIAARCAAAWGQLADAEKQD